jgi:hypothetical protein
VTTDPRPSSGAARSILYSGHMIDAPDRAEPRFPPTLEHAVAAAVTREVDRVSPDGRDVAFGSGACGSDLLFAEALLARGVPLRLYLPFPTHEFVARSVAFAGPGWLERFDAAARRSTLLVATDVLGEVTPGTDPFERTNLWMLDDALHRGGGRVVFLCVWNGQGGDGPGGTRHMLDAVRGAGGEVRWIDVRSL